MEFYKNDLQARRCMIKWRKSQRRGGLPVEGFILAAQGFTILALGLVLVVLILILRVQVYGFPRSRVTAPSIVLPIILMAFGLLFFGFGLYKALMMMVAKGGG